MTERLTVEEKLLRKLPPGMIADEALDLKERIEALKGELVRRGLTRAEGAAGRVTLSPPGEQDRTDRRLLLGVLGIGEAEFVSRFTHKVQTDWRLTVSRKRSFQRAA